jgi:hypothetical protein
MKYILEIDFEKEMHCLQCPLRDTDTDGCNMQIYKSGHHIEFGSWKEQLKDCPLKQIEQ